MQDSRTDRPRDVALADLTTQGVTHHSITAYRTAYFTVVEAAGASLLIPGAPGMLQRLREAGHAIGVVTARNTTGAEHLPEMIGIRHLADVLVGTERVLYCKPARDSGLLALEELSAEAVETWYVGDAVSDMSMAISAGMKPLGVTSGIADRKDLQAAGLRRAKTPAELATTVINGVPQEATR